MPEYMATFTTGFGELVRKQIGRDLPGIKVLKVYDGLIHFSFPKRNARFENLVYLNNIYSVLERFHQPSVTFRQMITAVCGKRQALPIPSGSFRIRFSRENKLVGIDPALIRKTEMHFSGESRLKVDRVNPSTEIWFVIRNDGIAFCGQLLFRRKFTEKNLAKGELRPEFAFLICLCADLKAESVVYDPFCGYGAIPKQLVSRFRVKQVLASDLDRNRISALKNGLKAKNGVFRCFQADALALEMIPDHSVDAIITDPPWGFFEQIDDIGAFYGKMLLEFRRIAKPDASLVVLSARKQEFENACAGTGLKIHSRIDTLVNGKKAAVFVL